MRTIHRHAIRRRSPALLVLFTILLLLPCAGATARAAPRAPELDARAWLLVDERDGTRLAGHAASRRLPIASTTKLMTAYLALRELPLDAKLKAPPYQPLPAESVLGLRAGERISVRDLLVAMMLPSANDAAYTVAAGVSGTVPKFVRRMNGAAARLGLEDTSYANPIGLDDPDNGSSARDLAKLTGRLLSDRRFRRIVAKPEATLRSGERTRTVRTRNTLLLSDDSVEGVKTGHTLGARYVLVALAERKGVPLLSVVLGAPSEAARDAESERLLDYGFSLYRSRPLVRRGEPVGTVPVGNADEPLELRAGVTRRAVSRADQSAAVRLRVPDEARAPIDAGERVGRAIVTLDGERIGAVPAVAARDVAAPGPLAELGTLLAVVLIGGGSMLVGTAFVLAIRRGRGLARDPGMGRTAEQRKQSQRRRMRRRREQEGDRA